MTQGKQKTATVDGPLARAALTFDPSEYSHLLADCDWTDEQKREVIETLWRIVVSFVDLGFDLNPVQQVLDAPKMLDADSRDMLILPDNLDVCGTNDTALDQLVGAERLNQ